MQLVGVAAPFSVMTECAKCGACSVVCPVFRISGREGHTARGRLHLRETVELAPHSAQYEELFSACLLCGACAAVCPRGIDIRAAIIEARAGFSAVYGQGGYQKFLARKALAHPGLLAALGGLGRGVAAGLDPFLSDRSGLRLRLALFEDSEKVQGNKALAQTVSPGTELSESGLTEMAYFPGCVTHALWPHIADSCATLVAQYNLALTIPDGLVCCGLAAHAAGDRSEAHELACRNLQVLERTDGPILVSCASCYAHLHDYPKLLAEEPDWHERALQMVERLRELTTFLMQQAQLESPVLPVPRPRRRVFYHDPCHFRHQLHITAPPRELIRSCPGLELVEPEDEPGCCGMGGLFHLGEPELSGAILEQLLDRVLPLEPEVITSTCSGCLMQWRMAVAAAGLKIPVVHLAALLAEEAGLCEKVGSGSRG